MKDLAKVVLACCLFSPPSFAGGNQPFLFISQVAATTGPGVPDLDWDYPSYYMDPLYPQPSVTAVLTNIGTATTSLLTISIGGFPSNFYISMDDCTGTSLSPMQTCNVEITFSGGASVNRPLQATDGSVNATTTVYGCSGCM